MFFFLNYVPRVNLVIFCYIYICMDIIAYVKSWWHGDVDSTTIINTCIVLIPKCDDPKCMVDFRAISVCNVLYILISKILANKLMPFLYSIISQQHSAFVPKRVITDNAFIAFETFHAMKRRRESVEGSSALRLDMSNTYDIVKFFKQVM